MNNFKYWILSSDLDISKIREISFWSVEKDRQIRLRMTAIWLRVTDLRVTELRVSDYKWLGVWLQVITRE